MKAVPRMTKCFEDLEAARERGPEKEPKKGKMEGNRGEEGKRGDRERERGGERKEW